MDYLGEFAALGTAIMGASNSVFLSLAGRRFGAQTLNWGRLVIALAILVPIHCAMFGTPFPFGANGRDILLLIISGLIGLALGDALLFEAIVILGPRVPLVLMTLSPIFSAMLAWIWLDQAISVAMVASILVTLIGVGLVTWEGSCIGNQPKRRPAQWGMAVVLGVGSALVDSMGMVLSNLGMTTGMEPISANLIRVLGAAMAIGCWLLARVRIGKGVQKVMDGKAFFWLACVAVTGPVLGVASSLYALAHAPLGVAATLMSMAPIFLLLASIFFFRERVGWKAITGTLLSILGTGCLFLV